MVLKYLILWYLLLILHLVIQLPTRALLLNTILTWLTEIFIWIICCYLYSGILLLLLLLWLLMLSYRWYRSSVTFEILNMIILLNDDFFFIEVFFFEFIQSEGNLVIVAIAARWYCRIIFLMLGRGRHLEVALKGFWNWILNGFVGVDSKKIIERGFIYIYIHFDLAVLILVNFEESELTKDFEWKYKISNFVEALKWSRYFNEICIEFIESLKILRLKSKEEVNFIANKILQNIVNFNCIV